MQASVLFSRLNWDCDSFKAAGAARAAGDDDRALSLVIEHFVMRTKPVYLFNQDDIAAYTDHDVIADADKILRNEILGAELGDCIDWRYNPTVNTTRDPEWIWSLARMLYLQPLARAYALTKDEKYAVKYASLICEFYEAWPVSDYLGKLGVNAENIDMSFPGNAWRTIETAMRLYCAWFPTIQYMKASPSLDTHFWTAFLNGVFDHAELLHTHCSNHTKAGNWVTMEATGLFQAGVLFPEFAASEKWRMMGLRRVTHESRYQFDHYGIHSERTPIYHMTAAGAFLQAYRLMLLNGITVPRYMLPILEGSAEYLMMLVKPDFTTPMLGDADRNDLTTRIADVSVYEGMNNTMDARDANEMRAFFRVMAELTGREDFKYFATKREEGMAPEQKNWCLPDPGYAVMRSGWKKNDSYMLVTGTNLERGETAGHSNYDAGHLELQIEGEDVLIDTGRYLYSNIACMEWRHYFRSTNAHNTVLVDGHKMGDTPNTAVSVRGTRTFFSRFESSPTHDLIEIMHNGYCYMEYPVYHERRVIWVKPGLWIIDDLLAGEGEHEYELFFNFPERTLTSISDLNFNYKGENVSVDIIPLLTDGLSAETLRGSNDPIGGWVSYGYSLLQDAPQLKYKKKGAAPARFITAIATPGTNVSIQELDGRYELTADGGGNKLKIELGADGSCSVID